MKRIGLRRALSAFVVVTAIVGVMMVGLVGQASAVSGVEPVAGAQKSANPNKDITVPVTTDVGVGQTVIISVATGTFAGNVSCSDSEGNVYNVRADRNGGSGRLFVCESQLTTALGTSDTVKATYPGFSGTSVLSAIGV